MAVIVFARVRLAAIPLERDEGEYAYGGQLLLEGLAPYQLAYSVKLPGTSATYAAIMAMFGQTPKGIHLGFLLVNLASVALLFLVARRLVGEARAVVAATVFALLSSSPGVLGLQGHATHLVVLFALGGIWMWLRARESQRALWLFSSGLCFGLSFLCKQPGLFFGLFGGAMILWDELRARPVAWKMLATKMGLFLMGLGLPFALTCLVIWEAGTFGTFWFWTIQFAPQHAGVLSPSIVWSQFVSCFSDIGSVCLALPVAAIGLVCLFTRKAGKDERVILIALLGFSWLSFCAGLYFTRHYFIVVLPAISLLTAVAWNGLAAASNKAPWLAPACLALGCCVYIFLNAPVWFKLSPEAVCRLLYGNNPFIEAPEIGRFIKENSAPDAQVAVFGSEPEILFYAHRRSATGFIYMYDLVWRQKHAHEMQLQMIQEIDAAKPTYVVMVNDMPSWMFWRDSDTTVVHWANDLVDHAYDDAGAAYIYPDHSEFAWTAAAMKKTPDTQDMILLYRRKPLP